MCSAQSFHDAAVTGAVQRPTTKVLSHRSEKMGSHKLPKILGACSELSIRGLGAWLCACRVVTARVVTARFLRSWLLQGLGPGMPHASARAIHHTQLTPTSRLLRLKRLLPQKFAVLPAVPRRQLQVCSTLNHLAVVHNDLMREKGMLSERQHGGAIEGVNLTLLW